MHVHAFMCSFLSGIATCKYYKITMIFLRDCSGKQWPENTQILNNKYALTRHSFDVFNRLLWPYVSNTDRLYTVKTGGSC